MPKKITIWLSFGLIITLASLSLFFYAKTMTETARAKKQKLTTKYKEKGDSSYLLQAALIYPQKSSGKTIVNHFLDSRDYQAAIALNHFLKLPEFDLLITEAAIENNDLVFAQAKLDDLSLDQKKEVESFLKLIQHGKPDGLIENPQTNSGRFLEMIVLDDFSLYSIDTKLGRRIEESNQRDLCVIALFNNMGFLRVSQYLGEKRLKESPCAIEIYTQLAQAQLEEENYQKSLSYLKDALACNPNQEDILITAIETANLSKNQSLVDKYTKRLQLLKNIGDK